MLRCPGQNQRFWKPDDIFEVQCPGCGHSVEFFKDEPKLNCRKCGRIVVNPKMDSGCAKWCQYAQQCIGVSTEKDMSAIQNKLIDEIRKILRREPKFKGKSSGG